MTSDIHACDPKFDAHVVGSGSGRRHERGNGRTDLAPILNFYLTRLLSCVRVDGYFPILFFRNVNALE